MDLGIAPQQGQTGLAGRLAWMTGLRLVFFTLLLAAVAVFYLGGELERYTATFRVVFLTIALAYLLAAVYAALLRRGKNLVVLAYAQIILDPIIWTPIVYVTGGPTSAAASFYAFSCLAGASLVGLRGAFTAAGAGGVSYLALSTALEEKWILPPADQTGVYTTGWHELVYPFAINGLGILVVALLAGYLSERLRITGGALAEATVRAEEAERLAVLGRVAAGLAHEIRNPLGSIRGSVEMLGESPALSAEDKALCAIIQRETTRLSDLVNDMLELSKPHPPAPEAIDLVSIAQEVVALAGRSERSATGDVRVLYVGPAEKCMAKGDGGQIRQVLWNLVRNAVQASPAGSVVTVRVAANEHETTVSVDDAGPGVTAEAKARIFDAFYTTRSQGVGLGLAVVKRIMDEHAAMGGRIEVGDADAGGASFRLTLRGA